MIRDAHDRAPTALSAYRSLLFVPADSARKLRGAWDTTADAVIVDLEDAVAESAKVVARQTLDDQLSHGAPRGGLFVRINALESEHARRDLELVRTHPQIEAIVVPKATVASLVRAEIGVPVIALVESALGILEADTIADLPIVAALMIGTVDLALELGVTITAEGRELLHARSRLVLAAAAAGLPAPIDGVWAAFRDSDGLRLEAGRSRELGFAAKACIHPAQVSTVNDVFSPTADELAWAERTLAAFDRDGRGAIALDGEMVDRPVAERARQIVSRGDLAAARRTGPPPAER